MNILITGASSGIGEALALYYAKSLKDDAHLCLFGRDETRLKRVQEQCNIHGATVSIHAIDVTDDQGMLAEIDHIDQKTPIDLVIANAGISVGQKKRTPELVRSLFDINVNGVLNTVMPLIKKFQSRQKGHIVVVSSLAAFKVFPGRGSYAATKIAVRYLADSWRMNLKQEGIHVTSIHPGFVKTPLTDQNNFKMPGIVTADEAARRIAKGIHRKKAQVIFPYGFYLMVRILAFMPPRWSDWIIGKAMKS